MADDVAQLVQRSLAGEQLAMVQLVDQFRGLVFGLCYRMLGHRQDAEDMTQETFVRALRSLDTWRSDCEFRPWLLAIAGNRCRTFLAKQLRRPASVSLGDHPLAEREDLQAARQLGEELDRGLAGLREEYRQAFLLYHEQELSYAEIAAAMDCPVGTVKTWVHRARRELVEQLRKRGVIQESRHAVRSV